jgi:hypothetical protein
LQPDLGPLCAPVFVGCIAGGGCEPTQLAPTPPLRGYKPTTSCLIYIHAFHTCHGPTRKGSGGGGGGRNRRKKKKYIDYYKKGRRKNEEVN